MLTKDQAVCLRAVDYSETSQIVTLFARAAGKISAIAKGSKRAKSAFDGPVEILSHGHIIVARSDKDKLSTLTEFQQQPGFMALRGNLFALNCCMFAAELVNSLTHEHDAHPELYEALLQFLSDTNSQPKGSERREVLALLILFQLTLLREVGLQPVLHRCANCKSGFSERWRGAYFSSLANGLICGDCEGAFAEKVRLTGKTANCLANLKTLGTADDETLHGVEKLLVRHFTEILHRPPRMARQVLSG
jgi:DNA repair protein RecO (recombination protein O)